MSINSINSINSNDEKIDKLFSDLSNNFMVNELMSLCEPGDITVIKNLLNSVATHENIEIDNAGGNGNFELKDPEFARNLLQKILEEKAFKILNNHN